MIVGGKARSPLTRLLSVIVNFSLLISISVVLFISFLPDSLSFSLFLELYIADINYKLLELFREINVFISGSGTPASPA